MRGAMLVAILVFGSLGLGGCAWLGLEFSEPAAPVPPSEPVTSLVAPPGAYADAFDAVRDALRDRRFVVDRLDGANGVVTTAPKESAGLATPWDMEQTSLREEWQEFVNYEHRVVRVTFHAMDGERVIPESDDPTEPMLDLRRHEGPVRMDVAVIVERNHRPGWRLEPNGARLSSFTSDPALQRRGLEPRYATPYRRDDWLAQRLVRDIGERVLGATPAEPRATSGE